MKNKTYTRLINRGLVTPQKLAQLQQEAADQGRDLNDLLIESGVPKHELLFSLSEHYGVPYVEYDEGVVLSSQIVRTMDLEHLKHALWLPLSITRDRAEIVACAPDDPEVQKDIHSTLQTTNIDFRVALPTDLIRIIEHNLDLNPGFPRAAGRTQLAKVRTFLADRRSLLSSYRTALAKGRTGLAFLRTGVSFMMIAFVLFRVFGAGYLGIAEALLFVSGGVMALDGIRWYLPARKISGKTLDCIATTPTKGTSVLEVVDPGDDSEFRRTGEVAGADDLRRDWDTLSPVMRRRFLASDRTDLAEERTALACLRTTMAKARTGLSFTRTGISFIGLGIAMVRQFPTGWWIAAGSLLIALGSVKTAQGFSWYFSGRRAAEDSTRSIRAEEDKPGIWRSVFPPAVTCDHPAQARTPLPMIKGFLSPGIWATTGLALERTLLAERRNVMARLRTIMARSRTGMTFIRTGMSISAVGLGLLITFGTENVLWTIFDLALMTIGVLFIADGLTWHLPAEAMRKQFPYCLADMEIAAPDYGTPVSTWRKAVFSHDDL